MPRAEYLDALLEAATEQAGYVTAAQAAKLGVPHPRLAELVASGDLRRIRHGVYAMRHARHQHENEIAAWLSLDRKRLPWDRRGEPAAVLSHASAAALHDLGSIIPRLPALTVPPQRGRLSRGEGLELHVAPLTENDWTWLRFEEVELPVTTPARTIVDLVLGGEERSYLERAVEEARATGRLSATGLLQTARRRKQRSATLVDLVERLLPEGGQ